MPRLSTVEPALTLIGPVTLDLAGHTISCARTGGVELRERSAKVKNGRVTGCSFAVVRLGDGSHGVELRFSTTITVSNNTLLGNGTDASDNTDGCDSNRWLRNIVGSTSQSCIH